MLAPVTTTLSAKKGISQPLSRSQLALSPIGSERYLLLPPSCAILDPDAPRVFIPPHSLVSR